MNYYLETSAGEASVRYELSSSRALVVQARASDNSLSLFGQAAKILLAESDAGFNNELSELLENRGYVVDSCSNGEECLNRLSTQHYQLIILDMTLPEIDGLSLLGMLRKTIQTPVIMLTNNGAEEERIKGFCHGADDCLTKPFNTTELLLRVWALLRRCRVGSETTHKVFQLQLDGLHLDKSNKSTWVHGKTARLTPTEFRLTLGVAAVQRRCVEESVFVSGCA